MGISFEDVVLWIKEHKFTDSEREEFAKLSLDICDGYGLLVDYERYDYETRGYSIEKR